MPVRLERGQTITSLYHSPFDYNLLYLICLAKTGVKLRIVLDDIDNLGINREDKESKYFFQEKYFLSKTERTNVRSLSLILPKHLFANLAIPSLKKIDSRIGLLNIKDMLAKKETVEHWIQNITRDLGSSSIIGPDRAYSFVPIDKDFVQAISEAKNQIKIILSKFSTGNDEACVFIDWLLEIDIETGMTIANYYENILRKLIKKFGLEENVLVEKMSDVKLQENNKSLLEDFKDDPTLRRLYAEAVSVDNKKKSEDFPFYAVSKKDGRRLLPLQNYLDNPREYILVPKVLMLNNFENLVLPYHAINKPNVLARELMYTSKKINSNQIFCNDRWVNWLESFNLTVNLDETESYFYNKRQINLMYLSEMASQNENVSPDIEKEYKKWVISSTLDSLEQLKYPLIFLALLQDKIFYKKIPDFYRLNIEQK